MTFFKNAVILAWFSGSQCLPHSSDTGRNKPKRALCLHVAAAPYPSVGVFGGSLWPIALETQHYTSCDLRTWAFRIPLGAKTRTM
jgi:hypothetical protein